MNENHLKAIEKLKADYGADPDCLALILCGSFARGDATAASDIDIYAVMNDRAMERIHRTRSHFTGCWDPAVHFGTEVDGKRIGLDFLRRAAVSGSEPTRASFERAYSLFCHEPEIEELVHKIARYPEEEQQLRARAFYSHVRHFRYVGEEASVKGNLFHYRHCVLEFLFYCGRLVLAHNRVLYPCHKRLFSLVAACPDKPREFPGMAEELMRTFSFDLLLRIHDSIVKYYSLYHFPDPERVGIILENEWTWYTGRLTIAEW